MKKTFLLFTLTLLLASMLMSCSSEQYSPEKPVKITSIDNKEFVLGKNMEKPAVVVFFATWCPGCKRMFPVLNKFINQQDLTQLDVIAIGREHTKEELKQWSDTLNYSFSYAPDPNREIFNLFADKHVPRIYLFDKDGKIVFQTVGFTINKISAMQEAIDLITKKQAE